MTAFGKIENLEAVEAQRALELGAARQVAGGNSIELPAFNENNRKP
jgi:hypothetical protein